MPFIKEIEGWYKVPLLVVGTRLPAPFCHFKPFRTPKTNICCCNTFSINLTRKKEVKFMKKYSNYIFPLNQDRSIFKEELIL